MPQQLGTVDKTLVSIECGSRGLELLMAVLYDPVHLVHIDQTV